MTWYYLLSKSCLVPCQIIKSLPGATIVCASFYYYIQDNAFAFVYIDVYLLSDKAGIMLKEEYMPTAHLIMIYNLEAFQFSSVQFSHSVVSNSATP